VPLLVRDVLDPPGFDRGDAVAVVDERGGVVVPGCVGSQGLTVITGAQQNN
jgi:hypothetical protein